MIKGGAFMTHRVAYNDVKDFTPIITDGKVYILLYDFEPIVEVEDGVEKTTWKNQEILLTKNEFDYHKSLIGIDNNFITNFIRDNISGIKNV